MNQAKKNETKWNKAKLQRLLAAMLVCMMVLALAGCGEKGKNSGGVEGGTAAEGGQAADGPVVEIEVEDYGTITVVLNEEAAPITVENFLKLVNEGFYDGLTFHRIIEGFMIQGGDPEGTGMGGADETIKGEFSENGVDNPLSHVRGTISMARSMDYDSASSQFFIVHEDSPHLNGSYAAFGTVTDGMDVVDELAKTPVEDGNGTVAPENQPVITSIKVVE